MFHDEIVVRGFAKECEAVLSQTSLSGLRKGGDALTGHCQYCSQRAEVNARLEMRNGGRNEVSPMESEITLEKLEMDGKKMEQWEINAERHDKAYEKSRMRKAELMRVGTLVVAQHQESTSGKLQRTMYC